MMASRMHRHIFILLAVLALTACSSWIGEEESATLPGERTSILDGGDQLVPDFALASRSALLPPEQDIANWPQPRGSADHNPDHPSLPAIIQKTFSENIGKGDSKIRRLSAEPIIANGSVFTLDASGKISSLDASSGHLNWQVRITPPEEAQETLGGGLAFDDGRLFATAGYRGLMALDPANGGLIWKFMAPAPLRAAPVASNGRVFIISLANELFCLSTTDGQVLWKHAGISETATLLGGSTPAIGPDLVLAAYSSGEIYALRVENGRVLWSDNLASGKQTGGAGMMADIRGLPVLDRGLAIAVSNAGRIIAFDDRSGARIWQREIGGMQTPVAAGDHVFFLTSGQILSSLDRASGRVRWSIQLDSFEDMEDPVDPIFWLGPTLAGGRLFVASSDEQLLEISPMTGDILRRHKLSSPLAVPPVAAGGTLYLLHRDGDLSSWR
ncbi:MAG TPA: pyrrolo-quinoline quinone [Rhodospirillaceae bacterium]|nr:MAG: hypothetical protein A2018_02625 [Alphaproteobacteria bacterium GWF2_58_20]HAU29457.1 pyrrolo-quinoline quinone [Rhodospirillaceae bacterium]